MSSEDLSINLLDLFLLNTGIPQRFISPQLSFRHTLRPVGSSWNI